MTPREHKVLMFVNGYIVKHGYSPTYREIANAIGYSKKSKSAAGDIVDMLVIDGFLAKKPGRRRSLTVLRLPVAGDTCPACGRPAA